MLVEKEKEIALNGNTSLKRKFVLKEKENVPKKKKIVDHTFQEVFDKKMQAHHKTCQIFF